MILDLIGGLTPIVSKLLDFIPDPAQKQRAELEMQRQLMEFAAQQAQQQTDVNKTEAAHQSIFVAGWRPAIGWICAAGFGWNYVGFPVASWFINLAGIEHVPLKPILDGNLMELTLGMLGLGAMRSFDKMRGTAK